MRRPGLGFSKPYPYPPGRCALGCAQRGAQRGPCRGLVLPAAARGAGVCAHPCAGGLFGRAAAAAARASALSGYSSVTVVQCGHALPASPCLFCMCSGPASSLALEARHKACVSRACSGVLVPGSPHSPHGQQRARGGGRGVGRSAPVTPGSARRRRRPTRTQPSRTRRPPRSPLWRPRSQRTRRGSGARSSSRQAIGSGVGSTASLLPHRSALLTPCLADSVGVRPCAG